MNCSGWFDQWTGIGRGVKMPDNNVGQAWRLRIPPLRATKQTTCTVTLRFLPRFGGMGGLRFANITLYLSIPTLWYKGLVRLTCVPDILQLVRESSSLSHNSDANVHN